MSASYERRPDDAIFAAIERQKDAWEAMDLIEDPQGPEWDVATSAEHSAWTDLVTCRPTSLTGVERLARHVVDQVELERRDADDLITPMRTIAQAIKAIAKQPIASSSDPSIRTKDGGVAAAMRQLEPSICDLLKMARIASSESDDLLYITQAEERHCDSFTVVIPIEKRDQVDFAIRHVIDLIKALERRFYAAYRAEELP